MPKEKLEKVGRVQNSKKGNHGRRKENILFLLDCLLYPVKPRLNREACWDLIFFNKKRQKPLKTWSEIRDSTKAAIAIAAAAATPVAASIVTETPHQR